jgi:predicted GNAT family acetyltransferase
VAENDGTLEVVHEPEHSRFAIHAEGQTAVLDYQRVGQRLVLPHTGVPRELEGRGVGTRLAKATLDWAREEGLRVVPICPFIRAYLQRHPENADLLTRSESS